MRSSNSGVNVARGLRRSNCRIPEDAVLIAMARRLQTQAAVAREIGVSREALTGYLQLRPALYATVKACRQTPDQAAENDRRAKREHMRRKRAADPEQARAVRRAEMAKYGPEYRHRWNHYNRLRRLELAPPDELATEYALILRRDPCSYCGRPVQHIDHIEPIARGGAGAWDNLTGACADCNLRKGDRPLLAFLLNRLPA